MKILRGSLKTNGLDKKTQILKAAMIVFADKGFSASTISDLAKKAGVGEATIYNHFKNKLQILLSLPVPYIHDFFSGCDEQLRGLKNPEEKIRKFIWQTLKWSSLHKELIKVLITDIVQRPEFYESDAHRLIQKAPKMLESFLEQGKEQGIFIKNACAPTFNIFLFGTITYQLLSRIMLNKPFEPLDDFDDIAGAVISTIKQKEPENTRIEIGAIKSKKERILLAAELIFSQKMSSETTISEIATAASVADGTIYDYFKSKEDLLFCIFQKRMENFLGTFDDTILPQRPETKLKFTIYHFLSWVQENRMWSKVYIKDMVTNPKFYLSPEHEFMREHDKKLLDIFFEGREQGVFSSNVTPELFLALLFGPIYLTCLPWALLNRKDDLMAQLDNIFSFLQRAVKA